MSVRSIYYNQAIAEALAEEMERDPNVVLWGLDIGPYGGANGATKGLYERFGADRVFDMPVSELAYVGMGVGAAATGLKPVVELQFSDWITLASDMLINQAAKMRYMFGGVLQVPLVLRAPIGGYLSAGAHHSNCFEAIFCHTPGLKVVVPSTPCDAKGLLKSSIRDGNPVMFFEHKKLYGSKGHVPVEEYTIPIGQANTVREGKDLTMVTYAYMVGKCISVADALTQDGISAEVIDLRTVDPLDEDTITTSVKKTGRLIVVQESWRDCSVSSEIAARMSETALDYLDAPIVRVTAEDVPIPFSPVLEARVLPNEARIRDAAYRVMDRAPAGG